MMYGSAWVGRRNVLTKHVGQITAELLAAKITQVGR